MFETAAVSKPAKPSRTGITGRAYTEQVQSPAMSSLQIPAVGASYFRWTIHAVEVVSVSSESQVAARRVICGLWKCSAVF